MGCTPVDSWSSSLFPIGSSGLATPARVHNFIRFRNDPSASSCRRTQGRHQLGVGLRRLARFHAPDDERAPVRWRLGAVGSTAGEWHMTLDRERSMNSVMYSVPSGLVTCTRSKSMLPQRHFRLTLPTPTIACTEYCMDVQFFDGSHF